MLCARIKKKPIGGDDRDIAIFECEGVSVVNGAQTVGVIGSAGTGLAKNLSQLRVPLRLISLEDCPEGFDKAVTRATNTQNRIENRDFAALDPNQRRIASELLLDSKHYAYKSGDEGGAREDSCTIVEATVALACAETDVGLTVQAKRELGRLWEDIERPPYTSVFNDETSGLKVWKAVQIMRVVDERLAFNASGASARKAMVAAHGNRMVLHRVFLHPAMRRFGDDDSDLERLLNDAVGITDKALDELERDVDNHFPSSYLASLFKNLGKCREIDKRIAPALTDPEVPEPKVIDVSGQSRLFPRYPL